MPQNRDLTVPPKDDGAVAGGNGLPDPPNVAGIVPAVLAVGSPDTVVIVSGSGFYDLSRGLVNGQTRYTQLVSSVSLRITVMAADLANHGELQIAVKNKTASNPVPLMVQ